MNYRKTILAGYGGYIVQAAVNNFAPLLFLTFRKQWGISVGQLAFLSSFNFAIQLMVDLLSSRLVPLLGYRRCIVLAHFSAAVGMAGLAVFPYLLPPFAGLLAATVFYAFGGGMIEVLVSPIVEACPTEHKAATMSLLHSFYCWGQMATVGIATLLFWAFGIGCWRIVAVAFALFPVIVGIAFTRVPIRTLEDCHDGAMKKRELFRTSVFWWMMLLMVCAGAAELSVGQWASALAEAGLGVSKTAGDLLGPAMFALMMGVSRLVCARVSRVFPLTSYMIFSGILCVISCLMIAFSPVAAVGLIGCGLCGFSVGVMWPGTYSMASERIPLGGTAMFSFLALGGDLGCTAGPGMVGAVASACGGNYQLGIMTAIIFPVLLLLGIFCLSRKKS